MPAHLTGLDPDRAAELLRRQDALQAEARQLVSDLRLRERLAEGGRVAEHGSSVSGLMAWRDLDFGVTSPGLTAARACELMLPLLGHPRTVRVRYTNETGSRSFSGQPRDERYFFMVYHEPAGGEVWKIDVAFWLFPEPRGEEHYTTQVQARLTDETRLAILWLKDIWHALPTYAVEVGSVDIYSAVLDDGVRTPDAFDAWLQARGKRPRAEAERVFRHPRDT